MIGEGASSYSVLPLLINCLFLKLLRILAQAFAPGLKREMKSSPCGEDIKPWEE